MTQVVQVGVETTPGTTVAANKKLPSLSMGASIKANVDKFMPLGSKFPTIHAQGKEWVEAPISGAATYSELPYLLASLLSYAAPVQQGATTAYLWTHAPSSTAPDTVKTYTVERGSSVRADKFGYGIVSGLKLAGDRDKIDLSGTMLGQTITDGITLTASPTAIEQVPILPKEVSIFLDTTSGGLGTTKLTRALKWEFELKDKIGPAWFVDAAQGSWVAHVERPVGATFKAMVEADAVGMGLLARLRDGASSYVRLKATSALLAGTAFPYELTIDMALQVADVSDFSDEDGVYAIEWTMDLTHDSTWGKALTASVMNKQTGL